MFVDASAIVAVLQDEPEAQGFLAALQAAEGKVYCSPIARYEAVISMAATVARQQKGGKITPELKAEMEALVDGLLKEAGSKDIHISESIGRAAMDVAAKYGKLAGHPAKLNMGDCFAYACAKAYRIPLLYKGNDFAHTDLA